MKKLFQTFVCMIFFTSFWITIYIIAVFYNKHYRNQNIKFSKTQSLVLNHQEVTSREQPRKVPINEAETIKFIQLSKTSIFRLVEFDSRNWIFNGIILQYSTIAHLNAKKTILYIDLIVLAYDLKNYHLTCILFWNDTRNHVLSEPRQIIEQDKYMQRRVYNVKCEFNINSTELGNFSTCCIDSRVLKETTDNSSVMFSQRPVIHDLKERPKKNSIVNCVHLIRKVDLELYNKIKNWLVIQRSLGIDQVRFYSIDEEKVHLQKLRVEFPKFLDVTEYQYNVTETCSVLKSHGLKNCTETYNPFFERGQFYNFHERVATNDCLVHSRFTHKYMTNLDVDEVIFPRYHSMKHHLEMNKRELDSNCSVEYSLFRNSPEIKTHDYDLNFMIERMTEEHGSNVAFFHFSHYLFLSDFEQFYDLLQKSIAHKKTCFMYNAHFSHDTNLNFELGEDYIEYGKSILRAKNLTECLYEIHLKRKANVLDKKWTRALATMFNNRAGKSIYNTQLTVSINQHLANAIMTESRRVNVPDVDAYVGHFRDTDVASHAPPTNILNFSIRDVTIDVEYLYFLVNISNKF
jgi:hypothetical protein